ncbi:MAG TPA: TonB family protein [Candidatus Paceibacterota bacterium]|nr:TonB family protein [Verrucomicrobiota bacterium]HSA12916.1 TonB family protein [Candidatus Paceibacterota bacterium]
MNRLQQKCFVASAGIHVLLMVILVIGPAFLTSKSKSDPRPPLDYIPTKLIDAAFAGGGNPNGTPPPPAPPEPRPPTPAPPAQLPEPVKPQPAAPPPEPVKEVRPTTPDPDAVEPERKRTLPEVSTKRIVRPRDAKKAPSSSTASTSSADSAEQRLADARKRAATMIGATARSLRNDMAPGTSIEPLGPGGGGEVYAGYEQAVQSIYWHAWIPPQDSANDAAIARVRVTIASDGTVLSARIVQPSGDTSVDNSVQRTIDRVTFLAPFPEGARDKQRTYIIKFDLKAKLLSG